MDTLTHALAGALAGRAGPGKGRASLSPTHAAWATLAASAFPDIDFIIALQNPYTYLIQHRLYTHTLVLMPLWALLLAAVAGVLDRRRGWLTYVPYMALGLCLHIVMDAFNVWPLKPLWPLTDWSIAWPVLFVIDPLYTGIILAALLVSWRWHARAGAVLGFTLLIAYTVVQFPLNLQAATSVPETLARSYAQPLSPFHRRLVVLDEDGPRWAFLRQFASAPSRWGYRPADQVIWEAALHPWAAGEFVGAAWHHPQMAVYRNFAVVPYVHSVSSAPDGSGVCAWFADVRFTLPGRVTPFRWGMCRSPEGAWVLRQQGRW